MDCPLLLIFPALTKLPNAYNSKINFSFLDTVFYLATIVVLIWFSSLPTYQITGYHLPPMLSIVITKVYVIKIGIHEVEQSIGVVNS